MNKKHKELKLTDQRSYFKPFKYPWCFQAWLKHEQSSWLHTEVPMMEDVKDWKSKITQQEKIFLTNIFRFFTQGDVDVAGGYVNNYLPYFPQPEVRMMLCGFAAREALHVAAYSHLIETLGMPESTYNEFLQYQEMKAKHEYFLSLAGQDSKTIAQQIAAFSAFTEGMQLFSSFIMLLNFPRHGKMKGMGQIVTWSIVDEAVAEGTEVLTESGWKKIEDLALSEKIYQYDMNTKATSFVSPQKIQMVERDQSYVFESNHIHQHVSPNHRMITMGENGDVGEVTAQNCPDTVNLIVSGNKNEGNDHLTDEDRVCIRLIVDEELDVQWIYDQIPHVSGNWAREAVEYYLELVT
jgi:ribonucleotide reductase beta subunit family protein with ferritin-like domain